MAYADDLRQAYINKYRIDEERALMAQMKYKGQALKELRRNEDGSYVLSFGDDTFWYADREAFDHEWRSYSDNKTMPAYSPWKTSSNSTWIEDNYVPPIKNGANSLKISTAPTMAKNNEAKRLEAQLKDVFQSDFSVDYEDKDYFQIVWRADKSYPETAVYCRRSPDESYVEPSAFDRKVSIETWRQVFRFLDFWQKQLTAAVSCMRLTAWNGALESLFATVPSLRIQWDRILRTWSATVDLPDGGVYRAYNENVLEAAAECALMDRFITTDATDEEHAKVLLGLELAHTKHQMKKEG